jgi:hypothetical protein
MNLPIARQFVETRPQLAERDVDSALHILHCELKGLAHIKEKSL